MLRIGAIILSLTITSPISAMELEKVTASSGNNSYSWEVTEQYIPALTKSAGCKSEDDFRQEFQELLVPSYLERSYLESIVNTAQKYLNFSQAQTYQLLLATNFMEFCPDLSLTVSIPASLKDKKPETFDILGDLLYPNVAQSIKSWSTTPNHDLTQVNQLMIEIKERKKTPEEENKPEHIAPAINYEIKQANRFSILTPQPLLKTPQILHLGFHLDKPHVTLLNILLMKPSTIQEFLKSLDPKTSYHTKVEALPSITEFSQITSFTLELDKENHIVKPTVFQVLRDIANSRHGAWLYQQERNKRFMFTPEEIG